MTFRIVPLGDSAALIYLDALDQVWRLTERLRKLPWVVDVVPAYTSIGVFLELGVLSYPEAEKRLESLCEELRPGELPPPGVSHIIPCCYDFELDLPRVAQLTGLKDEAVIRLHWETEYTIYAIGFTPGFPYMGYLPQPLCGVPRLESPRLKVDAGSVGLTGRQTGIYPKAGPGGWNLIGKTPLCLVDVETLYFPLRAGDKVRFERIDRAAFDRLFGQRLPFRPL